jgi:GT2 family glycosyltransferase
MKIVTLGARALRHGPRGFARRAILHADQSALAAVTTHCTAPRPFDYAEWALEQAPAAAPVSGLGRISVVMPTCNTPADFLREAIGSVREQRYTDWQLCICDDASVDPHVRRMLEEYAAQDSRIRLHFRAERGGIVAASNDAIALADGQWLTFLDHDDVLQPDALGAVVQRLHEGADVVYTDHDCLGEDGKRVSPFFKPDWSLDLFLAQMYLGHLVAFDRKWITAVDGLREGTDGAQDYDMVLRCVQKGARVAHVPRVLYHWRQHIGSTAANADSKPYAHGAGRRAIQHFLDLSASGAVVSDSPSTFCYDVRYPVDPQATASIIIPTRDRIDLLEKCLTSLRRHTGFKRYEIIVVDNGSVEQASLDWLAAEQESGRLHVIRADVPFNWSLLNNLAAAEATGDVLVFLNNDTEITDPDWLLRLMENALRRDVGVAGPLLLYADATIQHAGVVIGMGGWADHVFKGLPPVHAQQYFASPMLRRNVLAVTGACMAIAADKFRQLGGFDESFIVCGSDVELCLRAYRRGLVNVYVPESRMIHHESKTRDPRAIPETDFVRSAEAYAPYRTEGDPYFNPNLDTMSCIPFPRGWNP